MASGGDKMANKGVKRRRHAAAKHRAEWRNGGGMHRRGSDSRKRHDGISNENGIERHQRKTSAAQASEIKRRRVLAASISISVAKRHRAAKSRHRKPLNAKMKNIGGNET